jgi:hypothetical protein
MTATASTSRNAGEDVWSEENTSPDAVEAALRDLLRQRHAANEGLAPARVLNLVVVVDRDWKKEISSRLERVGRYHASRTILCAVQEGREALDARVVMSYEQPDEAVAFGLIREEVEIDIGPAHLPRLRRAGNRGIPAGARPPSLELRGRPGLASNHPVARAAGLELRSSAQETRASRDHRRRDPSPRRGFFERAAARRVAVLAARVGGRPA